ncbi:MAG TPA: hypothetical protein VH391_00945 [Solirubrobacterales bacterium]
MRFPRFRPATQVRAKARRPSRRSLIAGVVLAAAGVLAGYLAAVGASGSGAARPEAGATPVKVASRPATHGEAAAAALGKISLLRRQTVKTRISSHAIMTNKNSGDFVGLTCPRGYTAMSGGAVTGFINLLVSHSAPIKPTGRQRYTPRTWWVAVTNVPIDTHAEDPLPWHPVVNCVNHVRVGK